MQRIAKLLVLSLAVGAVYACNNLDEIVPTTAIPTAGIRFIHAVQDTQALDMRFVDIVENNAQFNIAFRNNPVASGGVTASTQIQYKAAMAGNRHFRIFLSDTNQTAASTVVKDTTVALTAGSNYTVLLSGNARTGVTPALRMDFFEETVADPGTNVTIRVINATNSAIDVEQYTSGGAATGIPTTGWANIAAQGRSAYFPRATGRVNINVKPAGGGANVIAADPLALIGVKASFSGDTLCSATTPTATLPSCDTQAQGGTTIAGSAVTAIIFPRSVAGSKAPAGFTTTAASFMWDRRPSRGCSAPYC